MKRIMILFAVLAIVAAACSSSSDNGEEATEGSGDTATTVAGDDTGDAMQARIDACTPGEVDGDLNFYNWSEYIPFGSDAEVFEVDDLIAKFEEEYGVKVIQTFYDSNETMLAQIEAGGAPYDLIVPSDYMVSTMADPEVNLLYKLNKDAIPNLANLDPFFEGLPFDPDGTYSVPYQAGTTGIAFAYSDVDDTDGISWGLIFDEEMSSPYTGKISMLNDEREVLGAALKYLGYSLNTTSQEELDEASAILKEANDRILLYDSEAYDDLLLQGEIVVSHGWNGTFFAAFDQASTDDYDAYEDFGYAIPEEGGVIWVDLMAIPTTVANPCTALTFIDFIMDAENGGTLTNYTYYQSPNLAAQEYIYPEILEDPSIYPTDEVLANLEFIADVGDFAINYADAFAQAKG